MRGFQTDDLATGTTALFVKEIYAIALHYTALHCIASHRIASHYTALRCITLLHIFGYILHAQSH